MNAADRKKMHKQFKVGDVITWGNGAISHRIVEVRDHGVVVDATSAKYGEPQEDGRFFHYVAFDKNHRNPSSRGPIRKSDDVPDKLSPPADPDNK